MVDIHQYTPDELEKLRKEVLEWIERNDRQKNIKTPSVKNAGKVFFRKVSKETIKPVPKKLSAQKEKISFPPHQMVRKTVTGKTQARKKISFFSDTFFPKTKKVAPLSGKKSIHKTFIKICFVSLAVLVFSYIFSFADIYLLGGRFQFSLAVSQLLPTPAVNIDSSTVYFSEYMQHKKNIQKMRLMKLTPLTWLKTADTLGESTLNYLSLVHFSKNNNIKIIPEEFIREVRFVSSESGGDSVIKQALNSYGISKETYYQYGITPNLLLKKFYLFSGKSIPGWKEHYEFAESIREKMKNNFESGDGDGFQYQYNEKFLTEEDLGFVKKGTLAPEVDTVAFSLPAGEVSEIIDTLEGLYILQVLDSFPELDMVKLDMVRIDHGIRPEILYDSLKKSMRIKKYSP